MSELALGEIRRLFPALARTKDGVPVAYFDGPAGSQTPAAVAAAVRDYLLYSNANQGGLFSSSRESDQLLAAARRAAADFVGATDPAELVFGSNMTTLTFALSRALSRMWQPGDEIVVTQLDHDANITPWVVAACERGVVVRAVAVRPDDCTLDMDDMRRQVGRRTRLVAAGCASNAVGSVNPSAEIVRIGHAAGALVFLDAVHHAPHLPLDAAGWNCDFLVCSAYKFFGPHLGILYGKRHWLEELAAYKVRPASDRPPGKWETGTQNHEGIAGTMAAIDYLAELGRGRDLDAPRRTALLEAFRLIGDHEQALCRRLLDGLARLPVRLYGIADRRRLHERVATVSFTHARWTPAQVAARLARKGIYVWHGNHYAVTLTEALGLEPHGMVRVGLLHYNTAGEIDRLLQALDELS